MKKLILFVVLGLLVICCKAQTNYGYTYIGQRYEWLAGLFKALGLPVGDSARFQVGQHQRQGAVYMDTVNTSGSPNGFYIYEDPTGGNSPFWNRQTSNFQICQNRLLTPWNVSWQGTGYNFTVHGGQPTGQGSYQIGCSFYTKDSATVTLSPSDATLERIDVIYLDATGIHVREGDLAAVGLAQKPSITLDEIELTFITVSPGTTQPTLTQLIVWNENTESTVTNIGTTTDPNNLTNVFIGLKSVNVTNVNHNDIVDFEKLPGGSAWQVQGYDALVLAIKLKPTMPINTSCNIAVSLVIGSSVVGTEVIVPVTKSNNSTYQQLSVPLQAFGNLNNTLITKVRVRYLFPTAAANVYAGFYLDYIYFVKGLTQPQPPGPAQFTLNMPIGFTVNPSTTQQSGGGWTVTNQAAAAGQYYTKEGWVTLPDFVNTIGTLDGQAKDPDGGSILGNVFYFQLADTTYPGLLSPELYRKISRNDSVTNGSPGDTLLVKLNDTTLLVKALVAGTGVTFGVGAQNITINATGGTSLVQGEGIEVSGDSIHLGGKLATPALLRQERVINTSRKILHFTNGTPPTAGGAIWIPSAPTNIAYSPFQFISSDTLTANDVDPNTLVVPHSGLYASRQLYFADGIIRQQKAFGHQLQMQWNFKDTMSFRTEGGDYDAGIKLESIITPRGTGRQGIRASHGTNQTLSRYYATPTLLVNTYLSNTASNWIKVNGHLSGVSSYLVAGVNTPDTIGNWIYYTTGSFIGTSKLNKSYDFAPSGDFSAARVDSAYGWFDTARVKRHYWANKTVIGPSVATANTWSSSDQLKVLGNVNITDSLVLGKASLIGDSTGYDWVIRRRTDGSLFRIRADLMASFFSSTLTVGAFNTTSTANGLDITAGVLKAHAASASNPGMVIVGSGLSIDGSGVLSATALTVASPGSGNANGLEISGSTIKSHYATSTSPGIVSTATQQFTGAKTFNDVLTSGDEFRAQVGMRLRDVPGTTNYLYLQPLAQTFTKHIWFADDDLDGDTIAMRRWVRDLVDAATGGGPPPTPGLDDVLAVGQALTADRTTPSSAFNWTIDGSNNVATFKVTNTGPGAAYAILAEGSTDNGGVSGSSVDFYGGDFQSTNLTGLNAGSQAGYGAQISSVNGIALQASVNPASTNTVIPIATYTRSTTGTGATGLGGSQDWYLENASGASVKANQIIAKYTDATNGTEDSKFELWGMVNGVLTLLNTFDGTAGTGSGTVNSGTANRVAYYPATAAAVSALPAITANRALISDANGLPTHSATTATELGFVSGVTSAIQTQIDGKEAAITTLPISKGGTNSGSALSNNRVMKSSGGAIIEAAAITANRALISDANGIPTHATTTATEIGFVNGVTSAIQTQIDGKASTTLNNLGTVATNADIIPAADNARDQGSSTKSFKDTYTRTVKYNGSTSGTVTVEAQATGITPLVTTTTGQGYGSSCMEAREAVGSDFTGQNINTVQPMFGTGHDVWPLAASTSYDFEGFLSLNHGATSHSVGLSFELSGGASVTSISYMTIAWVTAIGTNTASQTTNFVQVATNVACNAAGANATEQIYIKGTINMNAAGNVTPSYTFSAQPTGTCVTKGGSYIKFCPKGTNTFTTQGPAN